MWIMWKSCPLTCILYTLIILERLILPVCTQDIVLGVLAENSAQISQVKDIAYGLLTTNLTTLPTSVSVVIEGAIIKEDEQFTSSIKVCSLLSAGASILLSFTSCDINRQAQSVTSDLHVPFIAQSDCSSGDSRDYSITTQMHTSLAAQMTDVIIHIALKEKPRWRDVVIFHDDSHEILTRELMSSMSENNILSTVLNLNEADDSFLITNRRVLQHRQHFVVLCVATRVLWLLNEVRMGNLDLLGPRYEWLIVDSALSDLDLYIHKLQEGDNVAVITLSNDLRKQQPMAEVVETWILKSLSAFSDLHSAGKWTASPADCTSGIPQSVGHLLMEKLQESFIIPHPSHENTTLYDIRTLSVAKHGGLDWMSVGGWSQGQGLNMTYYLYPDKHHGFNNRTFIIATLEYRPFVVKYENGSYSGICFDILNELARVMNFSYVLVEPADGKFGIRHDDGNFSGILGMLQHKMADLAVTQISISKDRQLTVDFSTPFMVDPTIILMQKPDLASSQIFICLGPFSKLVWIMIALSVLVVGVLLWLMTWYHPLHERPHPITEGIYDPKINIWQIFGALMQQGMVYIPDYHSSRILIAGWWFYTIIVMGTYNGNLIAFLTAPKVDMPINSLTGLANSGMKFGVIRDTMLHGFFLRANTDPYETIGDKIKNSPDSYLVDSPAIGLNKAVKDRNYAFLVEKSYYDTLRAKEDSYANMSCEFSRAEENFLPSMYAFPFQKGSPYVEEFSMGILKILEAGLMERWIRKWYQGGSRCTGLERTTEQKNISLAEAQGAFYILSIGLIVATIILSVEKCFFHKKAKTEDCNSDTHDNLQCVKSKNDSTETSHNPLPTAMTREFIPALTFVPFHGIKMDHVIQNTSSYKKRKKKRMRFPHCCTFHNEDKNVVQEYPQPSQNDITMSSSITQGPTDLHHESWKVTSMSMSNGTYTKTSSENGSVVQNGMEEKRDSVKIRGNKRTHSVANGVSPSTDLANGLRRWHSSMQMIHKSQVSNGHSKDLETGEVN